MRFSFSWGRTMRSRVSALALASTLALGACGTPAGQGGPLAGIECDPLAAGALAGGLAGVSGLLMGDVGIGLALGGATALLTGGGVALNRSLSPHCQQQPQPAAAPTQQPQRSQTSPRR